MNPQVPEQRHKRHLIKIAIPVLFCVAALALLNASASFRKVSNKYHNAGLRGVVWAAVERVFPVPAQQQPPNWNPLSSVLDWLASQPTFSIVQLGAYVGDSPNDPLYVFLKKQMNPARPDHRGGARAVLVEPIKQYYDRLRQNYAGYPDIEFANVAIAESEGTREMYTLNVDPTKYGYPEWLSQLSSLKSERMGKLWDQYEHNPDYKAFYLKHRTVELVKCITIGQLLQQYQIEKPDLLLLDVEGYEYEILKTLDFKATKPRFIDYERVLLQENEPRCREMLQKQGYILIDWGQDTLGIRTD